MQKRNNNNWFANNYDRLMRPLEKNSFIHIRSNLINQATGTVLEIGCGTGINFQFYQNVEVTAIEPNEAMRSIAFVRALSAHASIHVIEGSAEILPFKDNSFDTVVGTLVFCTIPDPIRAIREVVRVCKPGGKILLFEHIRHDQRMLAILQDLLTPVWKRLCDGCHLNRNTVEWLMKENIDIIHTKTHIKKLFITIEARNSSRNSSL